MPLWRLGQYVLRKPVVDSKASEIDVCPDASIPTDTTVLGVNFGKPLTEAEQIHAGDSRLADHFWTAAPRGGRPHKFNSPLHIAQLATEYFEWVESHPLKKEIVQFYMGEEVRAIQYARRPMTLEGLYLFIGCPYATWRAYRNGHNGPEWMQIIRAVEDAVRQQKLEGALTGFFNAPLVGRLLGIAEKTEVTGADGGPIQTEVSDARDKLQHIITRRNEPE